jgi:hypothetical protein
VGVKRFADSVADVAWLDVRDDHSATAAGIEPTEPQA